MKLGDDMSLQNFKIIVAKALINRYSNCTRSFPTIRLSKQKSQEPSMSWEFPTHMPRFQYKQMRCHYCKTERSDHKTFVYCQACGLYLCLTKEKSVFWSIICSYPSRFQCLSNTFLKISYSCVDCLYSSIINTVSPM